MLYFILGIGTLTWSPLAGGILTGKYDDGVPIYSRAALKVSIAMIWWSTFNNNNILIVKEC